MRLRIVAALVAVVLAALCLVLLEPLSAGVVGALGCAVLVAVTVTDIERRIVPNRIIVPATVVALLLRTALDPTAGWILACLGAGAFFLVFALIYPAGLGMGDVKLAAFLGAWLGLEVIVALFLGSILAVVLAIGVLVRHGSAGRKMGLPFAPFLAAGGVVALFVGGPLLDAWIG